MGQLDGSFKWKKLKGKILITCHNSKTLANDAIKNKADYLTDHFINQNLNQMQKSNLNILKWSNRALKSQL